MKQICMTEIPANRSLNIINMIGLATIIAAILYFNKNLFIVSLLPKVLLISVSL